MVDAGMAPLVTSRVWKPRYSAFTSQSGFVVCMSSTFWEGNSAHGNIPNLGHSPEWEGATTLYPFPSGSTKDPLKGSLLFSFYFSSDVLVITSFIQSSNKYLLNVYYAMDML